MHKENTAIFDYDITTKINELENRVNNISKPKLSSSGNNPRRPSTAPDDSTRTNSRVRIAHHMISQMQKQINREMIEGCSSTSDIQSECLTRNPVEPIFSNDLCFKTGGYRNKFDVPRLTSPRSPKEDHMQISNGTTLEECTNEILVFPRSVKCDAEKESDAVELVKKEKSIISLKNPPMTDEKPFCECMMNNPFNDKIARLGEITVMGMVNNFPGRWPTMKTFEGAPSKLETSLSDDEKVMDNFLIDSLRGEIEKVRHRLCEIGNRSCDNAETNSSIKKEHTFVADSPSGDHFGRTELMNEVRNLQMKNDELSEKLKCYKDLQENSMKKAKDTAHLLSAYEDKVNALHEQALKSSKIMAHSKEKFCQILRSRNAQIKNLFHINQQLKKTIAINQEQMDQLNNNYKMLKATYRELEKSDKQNKEENIKYRETMARLEEDLKLVYKECNILRKENVRFLKELSETRENVDKKYNAQFDKHKNHCENIIMKTAESEAKLIQEVAEISDNLQNQGNELVHLRSEVTNETLELDLKYKKLSQQYEALVRKFREYEQFDEIKCSCIEQELKEFSLKMKEKESIILRERDELRALVEELAKAIKRNKTAIHELNSTNEQQENVIDNLNDIIRRKDELLMQYQEQIEQLKDQYENAQREIDALKNEVEHKSSPQNENLEEELKKLREILNQEKDNNLIKQKIIQDHEETISDLKEHINSKSNEIEYKVQSLCRLRDEVDRLEEDLKSRELDLQKEKHEKRKILNELESINTYKEALVKQITDLENVVKSRCKDDELNQISQKETIDELEKRIREQKEDWEAQRKVLQKDKEKALHAAKFASQKLLDTVNDFQKQMCQQKAAQTKLALLLQGKEQQLESITMKVRSLLPSSNGGNETICPTPQNLCTSFCQIKQIYPGPERNYHSRESIEEQDSRSFLDESNSCSGCCDYSDN